MHLKSRNIERNPRPPHHNQEQRRKMYLHSLTEFSLRKCDQVCSLWSIQSTILIASCFSHWRFHSLTVRSIQGEHYNSRRIRAAPPHSSKIRIKSLLSHRSLRCRSVVGTTNSELSNTTSVNWKNAWNSMNTSVYQRSHLEMRWVLSRLGEHRQWLWTSDNVWQRRNFNIVNWHILNVICNRNANRFERRNSISFK